MGTALIGLYFEKTTQAVFRDLVFDSFSRLTLFHHKLINTF